MKYLSSLLAGIAVFPHTCLAAFLKWYNYCFRFASFWLIDIDIAEKHFLVQQIPILMKTKNAQKTAWYDIFIIRITGFMRKQEYLLKLILVHSITYPCVTFW